MPIDFESEAASVQELQSKLGHLETTVESETALLKEATVRLQNSQAAQEILQLVAQAVQQKVHDRISSVVSSCLSTVFEDPYAFKIVFERKRGKTEANLRFVREGLEVDPITASGGGMVDVAAFALRVACLMLHRPRLSRVVVLDEPFRFVSVQYQDNVRDMLEGLAQDLKIQIVMVTHIDRLATGKIIEM